MNKAYAEFLVRLARHFTMKNIPGDVHLAAQKLTALSSRYERLQELACNRSLTPKEIKEELTLEEKFRELAVKLKLPFKFGGDPRGYTVKCFLADGSYNTWGGKEEGYGVPTHNR